MNHCDQCAGPLTVIMRRSRGVVRTDCWCGRCGRSVDAWAMSRDRVDESARLLALSRALIAASRRHLNPHFALAGSSEAQAVLPRKPDNPVLRRKALAAVEEHRMPNHEPEDLQRGPGAGTPCVVCAEAVTKAETDLELHFARVASAPDVYHAHIRCYLAWRRCVASKKSA